MEFNKYIPQPTVRLVPYPNKPLSGDPGKRTLPVHPPHT